MNIARKSTRASLYNIVSKSIVTFAQFVRAILLVRILAPEVFGVYAFASALIATTITLPKFGMRGALIHRAKESEGESALRVHFTLIFLFGLIWAALLGGLAPLLFSLEAPWVLWVLLIVAFLNLLTTTGQIKLVKQIDFRRVAVLSSVRTVVVALVAVVLAWKGAGIWSLLISDFLAALITLYAFYMYRPVWRPRFGWSKNIVRYLLSFGRRTFMSAVLLKAIDQVDDLWTGAFLGDAALGFYSRAYRFATFPRNLLARPVNGVASGTYAALKERPKKLTQAFFRVNAFLVRTGFLLAGLLSLIAPEFIRLFLGAKWLPMLDAFRLMLIYTMLDPIKMTVASLFVALGYPEKAVRARFIQIVILGLGLVALGPRLEIAGVALAVDIMLVAGIFMLLWQARQYVQFSLRRMFVMPTVALFVGLVAARLAILIPGILGSSWRTGAVKMAVFIPLYLGILILFEKENVSMALSVFNQILPNQSWLQKFYPSNNRMND